MNHAQHIMIDIETWDTAPTAVVRAIAVVEFDLQEGATGTRHLIDCRLTVDAQIENGRTISGQTRDFWARQENPLSKMLTDLVEGDVVYTMPDSIGRLLQALDGACSHIGPETRVWRRGYFDTLVLGHLLAAEGMDTPWSYRMVRDVRTLDEFVHAPKTPQAHHPLHDCMAQIQQVRQALALGGSHAQH